MFIRVDVFYNIEGYLDESFRSLLENLIFKREFLILGLE